MAGVRGYSVLLLACNMRSSLLTQPQLSSTYMKAMASDNTYNAYLVLFLAQVMIMTRVSAEMVYPQLDIFLSDGRYSLLLQIHTDVLAYFMANCRCDFIAQVSGMQNVLVYIKKRQLYIAIPATEMLGRVAT